MRITLSQTLNINALEEENEKLKKENEILKKNLKMMIGKFKILEKTLSDMGLTQRQALSSSNKHWKNFSLSSFQTHEQSGFGTVIYNDHGRVSVLTDGPYSPAKHSITDFVVHEKDRGKGYGDALIKEVIRRYKTDIGAQASSKESVYVLHKNGFRLWDNKSSTVEEELERLRINSSVYLRFYR